MSSVLHSLNENVSAPRPVARKSNEHKETYRYHDEPVEVVVIFNENDTKIAIVENARGEQFDVPLRELKKVS